MTTKEKIITKSIASVQRKIEATQALLNAMPLSDMLQCQINKLTTKLVNLTSELQDLKRELFYIKREQK